MPTKIVLAGEGGQGVQAVAKIIALSAIKSGKNASYLPSFGVEQRGGVSLAFIQISSHPILYPKFAKANIAVAFCSRSVETLKEYLAKDSLFVYDSSIIENKYLEKIKDKVHNYLAVPAQATAQEKLTPKVANVILMGAVMAHLKEIEFQQFDSALAEEFADKIAKKPEIKSLNTNALKIGSDIAEKFDQNENPFSGIDKEQLQTVWENDKLSWQRFPDYCKGCGICIENCPAKAISASKDSNTLGNLLPTVDIDKCVGCQKCALNCPDAAIQVCQK